MNKLLKKSLSTAFLLLYFTTLVLPGIGKALAGNYISSVFLILPGPITTTQDFRISLWSDGRPETGDITGGGAINGAATKYAGYQVVVTMTPDSNGRTKIAFGNLTGFPEITDQNQFMMVEYKEDADPDTSYVIYDATYLGSAMERFPLIVNGPDIYQGIYTNDATTSDSFTLDRDDSGTDVTLQFGQTLNETLKWNDAENYFEFSDAVVVGGNLNVNGNVSRLDADNAGAGADVDIIAEQGADADGTLRYNATLNRWEISNDGGAFQAISTGVGGADDFETIYSADADQTLTTNNGILTFNTGTNDFVVDSNDWNVTAAGALDAASITSNGTLTATGTTNLNGAAIIGDGGDDVAINSDDWDVSSAGVASGFTGFTSTGTVNLSGSTSLRLREVADEAAAVCTTVNEIVLDTTEGRFYICTVTGTPGTWVGASGTDSQTLDTLDSLQFLRSDTSDNFVSGTLTFDDGTTLAIEGIANIGDGGDDVAINSDDWDISSAGVASGFTGFTSTGDVDLSGTDALRIRESANPTTSAACTTANEIIINTTLNRFEVCTVPGIAGAATWIVPAASDATTLDTLDSTQLLRSDASDSYTSGTLTFENGTTLTINGITTLGDGGDDIAINSDDWDISSAGVASGFTGFTSTGAVNLSGTDALRIRESANPTTSAACTAINEIILNTTFNRIEICTATGVAGAATWVTTPAGDASTFDGLASGEFLRSNTSDSFTSGTLTLDSGTTLAVNGVASIGDGGDDVAINSDDWDISSAGVASGLTGLSSSGTVDFSGSGEHRIRESSDPSALAACTTVNEIIMNTTLNRIEICTVTGIAGAATWVTAPAGDASSFDGLASTEFLRSNTSDNFTSGTLTFDSGTTLTVNGTAAIGDGGDTVDINSSVWDISAAGAASGLTGLTSTGSVDFSGAGAHRFRESANPTTSAACTTVNEIIVNTTLNRIEICTATGIAGAATWVVAPAGDASSFDGLASTQFLRSDASDTFTSGTLLFDDGTTFQVSGVAIIGDGGDDISINSDDWDISSAGVASGFTGVTSTGTINFSGGGAYRIRESSDPSTLAACATVNEIIMNTTLNRIEVCTAIGIAGAATWVAIPAGDAGTLGGFSDAQFLRSDASDSFTSGTLSTENGTTFSVNGTANIGDGGDDVAINSDDWDISSAGVASGFTGITSTGSVNLSGASLLRLRESANPTTSAACATAAEIIVNTTLNRIEVCTVPGGAGAATWIVAPAGDADTLDSLNSTQFLRSDTSSNLTSGTLTLDNGTTLTANGVVNIGDGGDAVSVNSSSWDVSSSGAASGFTTFNASGNITTSGGDFIIGTTGLTETTSATDSGAFKIGVFDEFTNSNGANVQDVLDDLDALIGSNAPNNDQLFFHPEYPNVVIFNDGSNNEGTLVSDRDNANNRNYYQWTSNNATTQDIDVRVRMVLPADFATVGDFTFAFQTGSAVTADNRVDITFINVTDSNTTCATSNNNANVSWTTGTITAGSITTGCTGGTALGAGDVVEVVLKLHDNSGAPDFSRIGFIRLEYSN